MDNKTKTVVDSFIIGGTKAGMSMPGRRLQKMIGNVIKIDIASRKLYVPTANGTITAAVGDKIIMYQDDSLEVEKV